MKLRLRGRNLVIKSSVSQGANICIIFFILKLTKSGFHETHYGLYSLSTGALMTEILVGEDDLAGLITFSQLEPIVFSAGLLVTGQFTNRLR
jgi:hypothetical protein